jgi:nucleoside-triphosphatase THEP1
MDFRDGIGKEKMKAKPFKWPALPPDHFPHEKSQINNFLLITGHSGAGKTTWCRQWAESVRADGWRVGGLLSPPVMAGTQKVAIDLIDLHTGERRQLAQLWQKTSNPSGISTGEWLFDPAVLTWGNDVLSKLTAVLTAVDLLIIDELGPLEFERGQGLQAAFDLIETGCYRMAGVVIRPSLLPQAQQHWPGAEIIPVTREPAV